MKILIAVDGSKNSLRAVSHVIELAGKLKETPAIAVITVHDDVALRHAMRFVGKKSVEEYLAQSCADDMKASLAAFEKAGMPVEHMSRTGHVAQEIADAASKGKYDLLVVGAKGRGSLKDILIGSVASRLAELSKVPVLLVK